MSVVRFRRLALTLSIVAAAVAGVAAVTHTQTSPPWHLDRIDQFNLPLNGSYVWGRDGTGVTVYVIDSAVNVSHQDFEGRATAGPSFISPDNPGIPKLPGPGAQNGDHPDHGTMVASIIGGHYAGVAKNVHIVSLEVSSLTTGSTQQLDLAAAIQWVIDNHQSPAVINISIAAPTAVLGGFEGYVESKISAAINAGITVVGIAGNGINEVGVDAASFSPSRLAGMITVGATDEGDHKTTFSNYGSAVDLFAPGRNIVAAGWANNSIFVQADGTSFAAPVVAGLAARYLQAHPADFPDQVRNAIVAMAIPDRLVGDLGPGSPNRLAFGEANDDPTPQYTGRRRLNAYGVCYFEPNENGPNLCDFPPPGRHKLDGNGGCYWDANDSGPDQCEPHLGRWKSDGNGGCYWEPNDDPPHQCDPNAHQGRWKSDGNGGCYWDANDDPPDQCQPAEEPVLLVTAGSSGLAALSAGILARRRRRKN